MHYTQDRDFRLPRTLLESTLPTLLGPDGVSVRTSTHSSRTERIWTPHLPPVKGVSVPTRKTHGKGTGGDPYPKYKCQGNLGIV